MKYNRVILDNIEREKAGTDYFCPEVDKKTLCELLREINAYAGTQFQYLSEIDAFDICGSGQIVAKYINKFSSESVKSILMPQIVSDNIAECDELVLQLYLRFKASDEYISKPGHPSSAHIYVRYDNAFTKLKSRKIKRALVRLAHNPRDVFYLPFTMRMLASWKVPELRELFCSYLSGSNITAQSVGINVNEGTFFPPLTYIKRELKFTAIDALKHYPSDEIFKIIERYTNDSDLDICTAAKKTLKVLSRKM